MDLGSANARGQLTTHVLDTASGNPAAGLCIELLRRGEVRLEPIVSVRTNADGRCDAPLLAGSLLLRGVYELVFHVGTDDPLDAIPDRHRQHQVDDERCGHHSTGEAVIEACERAHDEDKNITEVTPAEKFGRVAEERF